MKNLRKFIMVTVTRNDGSIFDNPLMMSEKHLLITMLNDHAKIEAHIEEVTQGEFKQIFGI